MFYVCMVLLLARDSLFCSTVPCPIHRLIVFFNDEPYTVAVSMIRRPSYRLSGSHYWLIVDQYRPPQPSETLVPSRSSPMKWWSTWWSCLKSVCTMHAPKETEPPPSNKKRMGRGQPVVCMRTVLVTCPMNLFAVGFE